MNLHDARTLQAGWHARLELDYARRHGGTRLIGRRHTGPLVVQKPFYPEGDAVCHSVILHPPGGIAGGDRLELSVNASADTHVVLTTPGATKWYRSAGARARQDIELRLARPAIVEWLPQPGIVFDGALAQSGQTVHLEQGARYLGWDITCLGRPASGQSFIHGGLRTRTRILQNGKCIWADQLAVDGASRMLESPVGLAGHRVWGVFLVAGVEATADIVSMCREVTPCAGGRHGVTALPAVLVIRYLGDSSEEAWRYFASLWQVLRPAVLQRTACAPRIWNT